MKLVYHYIGIFLIFQTTSNHFHPLQGENCDSNSRLVVDENDNGKVRLERVNRDIFSLLEPKQTPNILPVIFLEKTIYEQIKFCRAVIIKVH